MLLSDDNQKRDRFLLNKSLLQYMLHGQGGLRRDSKVNGREGEGEEGYNIY
jgi:hypothetical protein